MMKSKPQLSFWQIWNMCFGFLGIQFGFALQNANASRIFETLGASMDAVPGLWIAAPLTGGAKFVPVLSRKACNSGAWACSCTLCAFLGIRATCSTSGFRQAAWASPAPHTSQPMVVALRICR